MSSAETWTANDEAEQFLDLCDAIATTAAEIGTPLHQSPLDLVRMLRLVRERADEALPYAVEQARTDGASWSQVAHMLGTSKQAAQQRYGAPRAAVTDPAQLTID